MVCLSGHAPRQSHEPDHLVDDFLRLLDGERQALPFLFSAETATGNAYGLYWDGTSVQLWKKVGDSYTVLFNGKGRFGLD